MDGQGGITFEHKESSPNGWAVILIGGLVALALVIIAMAIFALANWLGAALASLAQYIGIGTLLVAGGQFTVQSCRGTAMIIEARGRAKALEREAEAKYVAVVRASRLTAPAKRHDSPWREVE